MKIAAFGLGVVCAFGLLGLRPMSDVAPAADAAQPADRDSAQPADRDSAQPAVRYIDAQLRVVHGLEGRVDAIAAIAEEAARGLLAGGKVYLAGEPGMVAELLGRAGGLCGAMAIPRNKPVPKLNAHDLVLFSDYGHADEAGLRRWRELVAGGALVVVFAAAENPLLKEPLPHNVRAVPVAIPCDSCLLTAANGARLIPTAPPALAAAEWTFVAELIGACRREGRQLAVYLSIFLDPGRQRLKRTQGLLFEPALKPSPIARGELARQFLGQVKASLTAIRADDLGAICRAAAWLREAAAEKKAIVRNFVGHLPPVEAGQPGDLPLFTAMAHGMGSAAAAWIRANLHAGDVYLFLGYQENEDAMAAAASAVHARSIFLTSKRPGAAVAADPLHLDINPHWPVTDGCLDLPGYDVKACPLSCIAGLTCYYAICAEAAAR